MTEQRRHVRRIGKQRITGMREQAPSIRRLCEDSEIRPERRSKLRDQIVGETDAHMLRPKPRFNAGDDCGLRGGDYIRRVIL